ncbi:unnamed protein product [Caenorhabditis nigoni]
MDCPADLICDYRHNVVGCEGSGEASGEAPAPVCDTSRSASAVPHPKIRPGGSEIVMICPAGLKFSQANQFFDYNDLPSRSYPILSDPKSYSNMNPKQDEIN